MTLSCRRPAGHGSSAPLLVGALLAMAGPTVAFAPCSIVQRHVASATRMVAVMTNCPKMTIERSFSLETEYQLNLGKAIDALRRDYPTLLTDEPDITIFSPDIELMGRSGRVAVQGIEQYKATLRLVRLVRNATMTHDEVTQRIVVSDGVIRVRWHAKLWMRAALAAMFLPSTLVHERALLTVDGVSRYDVNDAGMVYRHGFENIIMSSPDEAEVHSVATAFAWPAAGVAASAGGVPVFCIGYNAVDAWREVPKPCLDLGITGEGHSLYS